MPRRTGTLASDQAATESHPSNRKAEVHRRIGGSNSAVFAAFAAEVGTFPPSLEARSWKPIAHFAWR